MRKFFTDIRPFYRMTVPGLKFIERNLAYYEQFFGTPITRIPGEFFWNSVDQGIFMPHDRLEWLRKQTIYRELDVETVRSVMREHIGHEDAWVGVGWKRMDTIARAFAMKRKGPVDEDEGVFYPVFDWSSSDIEREVKAAGVKLPIDYELFGRSFDSFRGRFLVPIKKHFPEDYEQIKKFFPLVDLELLRFRGEDDSDVEDADEGPDAI